MALAVVVLLPVGYLGSFLAAQVAYGAGWDPELTPLVALHWPIMEYIDHPERPPGSETLGWLSYEAYNLGYYSFRR
jgi:hypothetical protein